MRPSILSLCLLAGCGARGAAATDGGPPDTTPATQRSFQVLATLSPPADAPPAPVSSLPPSSSFTLVLDTAERRIIAGANGSAAVVSVTSADGVTFRATKPVMVPGASSGGCGGGGSVTYESLELTVTNGGLRGKAAGNATISCGDCSFLVPFQATLQGAADVTAPALLSPLASGSLDPFAPLTFVASEPLPATVTARLVAGDGSSIALEPHVQEGDVPIVTSFSKPDVVLRAGEGYAVALDGLVDFAGHAGSSDAALRLSSTPAAPLIAEDGFESTTAATLGGAAVVADPFATTGANSLYVGGAQAPMLGSARAGASLTVRLALQPGDTKVRFDSRSISTLKDFGFAGQVSVGSVGRKATAGQGVQIATGVAGSTPSPDGSMIFATTKLTTEIALPDDVTGEVLVQLKPSSFDCGPSLPVGGLLVDDLRAE